MNLDELIVQFLDYCRARNLSPRTIEMYRYVLTQWAAHVGAAEPSRAGVRSFLHERAALKASTRQTYLAALRAFSKWARTEHGLPDWAGTVTAPQVPKLLPKHLSVEDVTVLCEAAPLGTPQRALVEFLYATGARVSEAVGLRWDDLELTDKWARVRGKGNKERVVPFGEPAREALLAWQTAPYGRSRVTTDIQQDARGTWVARVKQRRQGRPKTFRGPTREAVAASMAVYLRETGGYVWPNAKGQPIGRLTAYRWTAEIGQAALGRDVYPHLLRHSMATHMQDRGADIRVIQHILGHEDAATTARYAHVVAAQVRENYRDVQGGLQEAREARAEARNR
ncbi:MAG: tyrosine-type recombinase/integrase [Dehalococcoidia bacterium]